MNHRKIRMKCVSRKSYKEMCQPWHRDIESLSNCMVTKNVVGQDVVKMPRSKFVEAVANRTQDDANKQALCLLPILSPLGEPGSIEIIKNVTTQSGHIRLNDEFGRGVGLVGFSDRALTFVGLMPCLRGKGVIFDFAPVSNEMGIDQCDVTLITSTAAAVYHAYIVSVVLNKGEAVPEEVLYDYKDLIPLTAQQLETKKYG